MSKFVTVTRVVEAYRWTADADVPSLARWLVSVGQDYLLDLQRPGVLLRLAADPLSEYHDLYMLPEEWLVVRHDGLTVIPDGVFRSLYEPATLCEWCGEVATGTAKSITDGLQHPTCGGSECGLEVGKGKGETPLSQGWEDVPLF